MTRSPRLIKSTTVDTSGKTVSDLMASLRQGDHESVRQLFSLVYPELRRLAAVRMKSERVGHSWQPTVLVNELYLELLKIKSLRGGESAEEDKQAFFRLAAFLMRRLLIHHARPLSKRVEKEELDPDMLTGTPDTENLIDIENALGRLEGIDPRLRTVVEMKVFEGRTIEEIAEQMDCSPKSVTRDWSFAQKWLHDALVVPGDPGRS